MHLILDAVTLMDLSAFEVAHKLGGAGQAPFAPSLLLSVLIYARGGSVSRYSISVPIGGVAAG